ncbi:hypothetical protein D3C86_1326230 [compost metagenome]
MRLDLFNEDLAQATLVLQPGKTRRPFDKRAKLTLGTLPGKKLQAASGRQHQGNHCRHQCLLKDQGGADRQQRDQVHTGLAPGQAPDDLDEQHRGHHQTARGPAHRCPIGFVRDMRNAAGQQRQCGEQQ